MLLPWNLRSKSHMAGILVIALSASCLGERTTLIRNQEKVFLTHDHIEPRIENGNDMLFNNGPGTMNLSHYRQGGGRANWYRGIFRHNIRSSEPFETGGRMNVLWLDSHVSSLDETTGDGITKRQYDPLGKN